MAEYRSAWLRHFERSIDRRIELLRGYLIRLRGAQAGDRFGLGRSVRVLYPECLKAGDDVTISDYAFLHCLSQKGVMIGNHTSIDPNLWLHCGGRSGDFGHGFFEIGDNSFIGCNAVIGAGGGIRIGSNVLIGQCVNIHSENHNFMDPERLIRDQGVTYKGVIIEDDVWIGSKATILDGVTVGCGAVVAAGAVVTRSVSPYDVVAGVPAKVIKSRIKETI